MTMLQLRAISKALRRLDIEHGVIAAGYPETTAAVQVASVMTVVPVGNVCSDILVVQPTQDRQSQRLADGLDGARDGRILLQ